jgi:hypothetical protein
MGLSEIEKPEIENQYPIRVKYFRRHPQALPPRILDDFGRWWLIYSVEETVIDGSEEEVLQLDTGISITAPEGYQLQIQELHNMRDPLARIIKMNLPNQQTIPLHVPIHHTFGANYIPPHYPIAAITLRKKENPPICFQ